MEPTTLPAPILTTRIGIDPNWRPSGSLPAGQWSTTGIDPNWRPTTTVYQGDPPPLDLGVGIGPGSYVDWARQVFQQPPPSAADAGVRIPWWLIAVVAVAGAVAVASR